MPPASGQPSRLQSNYVNSLIVGRILKAVLYLYSCSWKGCKLLPILLVDECYEKICSAALTRPKLQYAAAKQHASVRSFYTCARRTKTE